jgi:ADP-ribose pyrophosphatase YjhB (NUDIX family)
MEAMKSKKSSWSMKPFPTVDIVIEIDRDDGQPAIVLIERKNPPYGWALPGGFVDYGESLEEAAVREAKEETSLDIELLGQLHTYSDPARDPRFHTISTVYVARAKGQPRAQDDAKKIGIFTIDDRPRPLAFDHEKILEDYLRDKGTYGRRKQAKSR